MALANAEPDGFVFYTLDGTTPNANSEFYTGPFVITNDSILQTLGFTPDFLESVISDPIAIQIIVQYSLTATTPGGGTIGG